ncbi:MAG: HupE/UreJ family protein [Alphaproteobacteria bacterium]|nr:HupE/UreJ family protein [Alphaproteobacteria bacterium]
MPKRLPVAALAALPVLLLAGAASAHTGQGDHGGLAAGFLHSVLGLDHLLAMVAVGAYAARQGGRAMWAVPATFVALMVVGGALAWRGVELPLVEPGIALSVVLFGALVALDRRLPLVAGMALGGLFALAHGQAHGAEMPAAAHPAAYALGFVLATAALHGAGLALVRGLVRALDSLPARWAIRVAGAATVFAGAGLAAGA